MVTLGHDNTLSRPTLPKFGEAKSVSMELSQLWYEYTLFFSQKATFTVKFPA